MFKYFYDIEQRNDKYDVYDASGKLVFKGGDSYCQNSRLDIIFVVEKNGRSYIFNKETGKILETDLIAFYERLLSNDAYYIIRYKVNNRRNLYNTSTSELELEQPATSIHLGIVADKRTYDNFSSYLSVFYSDKMNLYEIGLNGKLILLLDNIGNLRTFNNFVVYTKYDNDTNDDANDELGYFILKRSNMTKCVFVPQDNNLYEHIDNRSDHAIGFHHNGTMCFLGVVDSETKEYYDLAFTDYTKIVDIYVLYNSTIANKYYILQKSDGAYGIYKILYESKDINEIKKQVFKHITFPKSKCKSINVPVKSVKDIGSQAIALDEINAGKCVAFCINIKSFGKATIMNSYSNYYLLNNKNVCVAFGSDIEFIKQSYKLNKDLGFFISYFILSRNGGLMNSKYILED